MLVLVERWISGFHKLKESVTSGYLKSTSTEIPGRCTRPLMHRYSIQFITFVNESGEEYKEEHNTVQIVWYD
jgi:hypothetical protein